MPPSSSNRPESPLPMATRMLGEAIRTFDPRDWKVDSPTEAIALGIQSIRSGLFVAESIPVFMLNRPTGQDNLEAPPEGAVQISLQRLRELIERDAEMIGEGTAPLSVLAPRDVLGHGFRLLRILADGTTITRRRRKHDAREFSRDARKWLDEMPAYYRRNFHYQTDGYLSEHSADLYEHQVELLFRGGADAMRRMIVPPLKRFAERLKDPQAAATGRGLRILELGSGTGSATQSVARCFPEARITCVDLSHPYTKHAQKQLADFDRVDCLQGDAGALDFGDDRFDAVYSVFLFHELPLPVREQVIEEACRVLRPGGFFGLVDSLQKGDDDALDWALDFFPREFHEPYYANYAANPMERLLAEAGLEEIESGTGYLAKWSAARAPQVTPAASPASSKRKTAKKESDQSAL